MRIRFEASVQSLELNCFPNFQEQFNVRFAGTSLVIGTNRWVHLRNIGFDLGRSALQGWGNGSCITTGVSTDYII